MPPDQPHRHRRDDDREAAQEREPVTAARRCKDASRTVEVPVEQRREGAEPQSFVDARWLEGAGHRRRVAGGKRRDKGRDTHRT